MANPGSDSIFAGSIPQLYEQYLVPLIFEPYALDLAQRVAERRPARVLEIAAGTGVLTRQLANVLAASVQIVATDLNQPMLDYAAGKQAADDRITWQQADALDLPFDDASFDVGVCQFGVMFFPDRGAGYGEARRVLKPGGRYIFNVWDAIEANEFAHLVTEAAATVFPDRPPRFMARTPHGYHDRDRIRAELEQAGFTDISIATVEETSAAPSPREPALAYCQGTPLRNEIEALDASLLNLVTERAAAAIAERFGDGPVAGKIRAHIVTAAR